MPIPIILPKFGFTLETADIVKWLKGEGEAVRAGDPICEVTTDKVNMEVEAPEAGTLFGLLYPEGATVPVTEVICYLLRPGETPPQTLPGKAETAAPVVTNDASGSIAQAVGITPVAKRIAEAAQVDVRQIHGTGPNQRITRRDVENVLAQSPGKVRATPAARHLAGQTGVNLAEIVGSGPRGRIQAGDIQSALATRQSDQAAPEHHAPAIEPAVPPIPGDAPHFVKLEGMRRTIAIRLQKSFQTAPHIFFDAQVDTAGIDALRNKLKARDERLSVTAVFVKACAYTLMKHPALNATVDGEEIALWPTANIGVAVALDAGLIVPVVHHAERLSLGTIQSAVDTLVERARSSTLHINDMVDGTFTISNLGMYGVDRFTAIINPPQVAILAVGRTLRQFVPDENDQPVLRSFMNITLSADHRVVDGAQAANFLQDLRAVLEEPLMLLW